MARLAIIGGSGFDAMDGLEIVRRKVAHTPYGEAAAPLTLGRVAGNDTGSATSVQDTSGMRGNVS